MLIGETGLAVLERLFRLRIEDANAVVVADASLLRNEDLEVLDRRRGVNVDRRRKILDGLPRRYNSSCCQYRLANCRSDDQLTAVGELQRRGSHGRLFPFVVDATIGRGGS